MKKSLVFAALAAAALAVSCQTKEVVIDTPDNNEPSEIEAPAVRTFVCEFASESTKYNIADDGTATWQAGDEILIHAGKDGNVRTIVTLTADDISADGKKATITITGLDGYDRTDAGYVSSFYAIFPASAITTNKTLYYESRMEDFSKPAMGACDDGAGKFLFYNMCGIIKYTVEGDFDTCEFSGNADETVGYNVYQCRIAKTTSGMTLNWFKYGNGYKEADVIEYKSRSFDVVGDGSTVNYIVLPKGVNLTSGFTMKFKKEGNTVKVASTNTPVNIERNKILPLGNITSRLVDYDAPTPSTHESSITGATDLSVANGPSNCYVISAPGAYKLPVVKGNSNTSAGNVFSVELLWESYNNEQTVTLNSVIANVDFDGPTNYVYFETPGTLKPGNALIAAKNEEDNIIWSWHIWIPETAFTTDTYGISSQTLMSRNLGALVDTKAEESTVDARSYGLIYQWGRKDPFLGSKRFNSSSQALVAGTAKSVSSSQFTIAQSIANPTTIVGYKGDWMTPENTTLWTESGDKSIYDPCPPGYRVPKRVSSDPLWSDVTALDASYGWEPNSTYGWWKLGTAVFPFAGYIDYDGGGVAHAYDRTRMWNAHKSKTEYAYDQQIWYDNDNEAWQSKPEWQHRTACGNVVRCVVDWTIE